MIHSKNQFPLFFDVFQRKDNMMAKNIIYKTVIGKSLLCFELYDFFWKLWYYRQSDVKNFRITSKAEVTYGLHIMNTDAAREMCTGCIFSLRKLGIILRLRL